MSVQHPCIHARHVSTQAEHSDLYDKGWRRVDGDDWATICAGAWMACPQCSGQARTFTAPAD